MTVMARPLLIALLCFLAGALAAGEVWPSDRAGLVFACGGPGELLAMDPAGGRYPIYSFSSHLRSHGWARKDRFGTLVLARGCWSAKDVDAGLAKRAAAADAFSLSCVIEPGTVPCAEPGVIAALSGEGGRGFSLRQEGAAITLTINDDGGAHHVELLRLADQTAVHLAVSWSAGAMTAWRDGAVCAQAKLPASLAAWTPGHLVFGGELDGHAAWRGRLDGIALRARPLDNDEVATDARLWAARRQARDNLSVTVRAKLVRLSPPPALDSLPPYYQALVGSIVEVQEVLKGACAERKLVVYQWAVLDLQVTPYRELWKNGTAVLRLEPMEANPQLSSEHTSDDLEGQGVDLPALIDTGAGWLDGGPPLGR
jgi:hypothetical protein